MSPLKKAWNLLSWFAGGYAIYNQLKTLSSAKNELFQELSPEQQAQWIKVFGNPEGVKVTTPLLPPVLAKLRDHDVASPIEQLKAGT